MEEHFDSVKSEISRLSAKVKQEVEGIKDTPKEVEKSLQSAWDTISDLQEDAKTHSDFKKTCQQSLDSHLQEIDKLTEKQQYVRNPHWKASKQKLER